MKYIAYGSNMVQEQMAYRCPDAKLIGTGYIAGARLEFCLHATVEKTGDMRNRVPVAVWEINARDEKSLDRYEGFPNLLLAYHDQEWGVPVHADRKHFEYLTLEVMQSPAKSSVRKRARS